MRSLILFLATGLGSGRVPRVPGTAGTVVGLLFYLLLRPLPPLFYGMTVVTFIFLAAWIATEAEREWGEKDCQKIVIDEIAGFLVTMAFVRFSWGALAAGFVLFRFFDMVKPFPCRWIEQKAPAGWGVVGDDLMAGVYANIALQVITSLL